MKTWMLCSLAIVLGASSNAFSRDAARAGSDHAAALACGDTTQDSKEAEKAEKEKKVRRLLEATRAKELQERLIADAIDGFAVMPGLPAGFADEFKSRFDLDELMKLTVDAYCEHIDVAALDAAVGFFESEAGKEYSRGLNGAAYDAYVAGKKYGERIGAEAARAAMNR